jgi:prepilin-type N-terminal cleavage/methylation domain-containing protein
MKHRLGFTLIEILVVVTIISILSAVLYASFGEARRDSQNKALFTEIKEVQLALELYKAQNGVYPAPGDQAGFSQCGASGGGDAEVASSEGCANAGANIYNPYIDGLIPEFIADLPRFNDSDNPNCDFIYRVDDASNPTWYKLTASRCVSGATTVDEGIAWTDELARCPTTCSSCTSGAIATTSPLFYESFAVYSTGGECQ